MFGVAYLPLVSGQLQTLPYAIGETKYIHVSVKATLAFPIATFNASFQCLLGNASCVSAFLANDSVL